MPNARGNKKEMTVLLVGLKDEPHTDVYCVGNVGKNSGSQISHADGADFVLIELSKGEYLDNARWVHLWNCE